MKKINKTIKKNHNCKYKKMIISHNNFNNKMKYNFKKIKMKIIKIKLFNNNKLYKTNNSIFNNKINKNKMKFKHKLLNIKFK